MPLLRAVWIAPDTGCASGVDAASDLRGDTLDHTHYVIGISEAYRGPFQTPEPFDVDVVGTVHQDIGDAWLG